MAARPGAGGPVGLVLAGGASRRMGEDKAQLAVAGAGLAERAAGLLAQVTGEVAVADRGRGVLAGLPSLADATGRGPVAGILGAAAAYPGRPLLVLACDLPAVPAALLAELARSPGADWAVPRHAGGVEPLAALYGRGALAALAERAAAGRFRLHDLAETPGLAVRFLEGAALAAFGPAEEVFRNLNTPADVEGFLLERDLLRPRVGG